MPGDPAGKRQPAVILVGPPEDEGVLDIEAAVDRLGGGKQTGPAEERVEADPEEPEEPEEAKEPGWPEGYADLEEPVEGPPRRKQGSLGRRIGLWLACYLLVAVLYVGFFAYPVQPAYLDGMAYSPSEKLYQPFPYTYEKDYISIAERSVVVVLTVRTIQVPDRAYSAALRNAEGITEGYLRQQYGLNVDVRFMGEDKATVRGHDAVRQDYEVYDNITILGRTETVLVAKMSILAWFCNENFISVVAGFFHRAAVSPAITEHLRCH